ncbi:hypothetical protein TNIN_121731 [Trichonephila inaurata madagascariensis]|uniref:Uncharacterized protein n=1 Tax=Trichonephila inaurata madagascariensis TaxID=2747483 RepID=A0A8X7BQE5_9ARAC|nr:hypothetical protein TNIN_121731 [Trichonephila inaurata madagascariensis]
MSSTRPRTSGNVGRLPRNSSVLQTPLWDPHFAGNDTEKKYRFYPLLIVRGSLSNTLARLDALTCTIWLRRGRGCAWDIQTHTHPF